MKRLLSGVLALTAMVLTTLLAAPATAADGQLSDPAGDADLPGLDIVSATLHNNAARVVVDVEFVRAVRGDLIVSIDGRHGRGLRLVSQYRPTAHTNSFVADGAFTDRGLPDEPQALPCRGFRVRWNAEQPTVRLILPSRCLRDGHYRALRFGILTERRSDTDFAPDRIASRWIRRG